MFVVVLIYALWPSNRPGFEHAKHIPLDGEDA
jgi:cbb3-type cytochrome oxidase subunit 3